MYDQVLDRQLKSDMTAQKASCANNREVYEKVKITAYPDRRMIPSKDFIFLGFNMQIACHFGPFAVFVEDIIEGCTLSSWGRYIDEMSAPYQ